MAKNNIRPNHIHEPKENRQPKVAPDMEKITSIIGIKNINWNEVRNHQIGHMKNKAEAWRDTLAKDKVFEEARKGMPST